MLKALSLFESKNQAQINSDMWSRWSVVLRCCSNSRK